MENKKTIIRVRRGIGDAKYCACDNEGSPIRGFRKLSDIRKHWRKEIRQGHIELVRELDRLPDMDTVNEARRILDYFLLSVAKS